MALCIQKMSENNNQQVFDISIDVVPKINGSKCFDDDGRLKRTGGFSDPSPVLVPLSQSNIVVYIVCMHLTKSVFCLMHAGSVWTASAHIITAVIGSGVLSLAWAIAQLGWIAGPSVMFLFSFVSYYTSCLLSDCYRSGDPLTGKRNYNYIDAVRSILGMYVHNNICVHTSTLVLV